MRGQQLVYRPSTFSFIIIGFISPYFIMLLWRAELLMSITSGMSIAAYSVASIIAQLPLGDIIRELFPFLHYLPYFLPPALSRITSSWPAWVEYALYFRALSPAARNFALLFRLRDFASIVVN